MISNQIHVAVLVLITKEKGIQISLASRCIRPIEYSSKLKRQPEAEKLSVEKFPRLSPIEHRILRFRIPVTAPAWIRTSCEQYLRVAQDSLFLKSS